eukprot:Pgem_evm1s20104
MSFVNLYSSPSHVIPLFIAFNDTIPNTKYTTELQNKIDMTFMHCAKQNQAYAYENGALGLGWRQMYVRVKNVPRSGEIDTVENLINSTLREVYTKPQNNDGQHLETIAKSFRAIEKYETDNINNNNTKDNDILKDLYHQYIDTDHYYNKYIVACNGDECVLAGVRVNNMMSYSRNTTLWWKAKVSNLHADILLMNWKLVRELDELDQVVKEELNTKHTIKRLELTSYKPPPSGSSKPDQGGKNDEKGGKVDEKGDKEGVSPNGPWSAHLGVPPVVTGSSTPSVEINSTYWLLEGILTSFESFGRISFLYSFYAPNFSFYTPK